VMTSAMAIEIGEKRTLWPNCALPCRTRTKRNKESHMLFFRVLSVSSKGSFRQIRSLYEETLLNSRPPDPKRRRTTILVTLPNERTGATTPYGSPSSRYAARRGPSGAASSRATGTIAPGPCMRRRTEDHLKRRNELLPPRFSQKGEGSWKIVERQDCSG
jgi:hypothetical protein